MTFTPSVTGDRQGVVMIKDNAATSPQEINLAGVGTPAPSSVSVNPTSLVFTNETVSVTSAAQTVTLKNTSAGPLTIASIGATSVFAETNTCPMSPATLSAGLSCTVQLTFTDQRTDFHEVLASASSRPGVSPGIFVVAGSWGGPAMASIQPPA